MGLGLRFRGNGIETPPMLRALISALALTVAAPAQAHPHRPVAIAAAVEVLQPWSRPATAGSTGAGYMVLANHGAGPAVLVKVESPLAKRVEIHRSSLAGGIMRMAPERQTAVPGGGQVVFAPGGYHLMFVDLARALRPGDRLPATLSFADGRRLKVEFLVSAGAGPPNGRN